MSFGLVLLAFGAGFLSFVSPCVLPLVPIYLGYLSGAAVTPGGLAIARREVLSHALAFILGFTTIFIAIWSALFALSQVVDKSLLSHLAGLNEVGRLVELWPDVRRRMGYDSRPAPKREPLRELPRPATNWARPRRLLPG